MRPDYRWFKKVTLIIMILLWIGFIVTVYKWITSKSIGEMFIGALMFIALIIGLGYFILWFESGKE